MRRDLWVCRYPQFLERASNSQHRVKDADGALVLKAVVLGRNGNQLEGGLAGNQVRWHGLPILQVGCKEL